MPRNNDIIDSRLSAHDQAVRLMANWVSAIADQVKNPVAGITAAASLIEKQMSAFRASEAWDPTIVEEAVRLMISRLSRFDNYLSELSGFTREVRLDLKWWDVAKEWSVIESTIIRRIPLDFRITADIENGVKLYSDLDRFTAMISALALNSVEACGTAVHAVTEVKVSGYRDLKTGVNGVQVIVEDNGPGFSEMALLEGLTPFFTTKDAGTGLGLAMVEKYMRAHGGWVKLGNRNPNEPSMGAVVKLFFPRP